jgi:hypothetical protein
MLIVNLNKGIWRLFLMSTATALLMAGCGGSDSGSVSTAPIMINADSGTQRSLNGTWQSYSCGYVLATGYDSSSEFTVSGHQVTSVTTIYSTNDGSCLGTVTATETNIAVLVSDMEITTLGWTDGVQTLSTPPNNQAATNLLQDPPVVSGVIWQYTYNGIAYADKNLMYMDDSAASWCIYFGVDPAVYGGTDANGYAKYLIDNPSMCKI